MEKNAYNPNYPHLPPQMTSNTMDADKMQTPAPPSYDQATGSGVQQATTYPPVQVLSTPQTGNANNFAQQHQQQQQQQQPSYPTYPSHHHNPPMSNMGQTTTYQTVQPMMQQPMLIIQQQAILPLGPEPTFITCPACHIQKLTRIEYEPSSRTHLMAALLCILGLWCCVCLPYCAGSCMNANHYCGNCNKFLGTYGNGL